MAGRSSMNFCDIFITHRMHMCGIFINLVDVHGKCREICPTWMLWVKKKIRKNSGPSNVIKSLCGHFEDLCTPLLHIFKPFHWRVQWFLRDENWCFFFVLDYFDLFFANKTWGVWHIEDIQWSKLSIAHRIRVLYIYLHLPQKSTRVKPRCRSPTG